MNYPKKKMMKRMMKKGMKMEKRKDGQPAFPKLA